MMKCIHALKTWGFADVAEEGAGLPGADARRENIFKMADNNLANPTLCHYITFDVICHQLEKWLLLPVGVKLTWLV